MGSTPLAPPSVRITGPVVLRRVAGPVARLSARFAELPCAVAEPTCSPARDRRRPSPARAAEWAAGGPRRDSGRVRTWTVEEARAYLPRLRSLLAVIDATLVAGPEPDTVALPIGAEQAEAALAELEEGGIVLRQVGMGLVDFVWRGPDGELRLLCYRLDEADLTWWHRPEDGFAGRRAIADITWPSVEAPA